MIIIKILKLKNSYLYLLLVWVRFGPRFYLAAKRAEISDLNLITFLNKLGHEQNRVDQALRACDFVR